jgi:hypothetical protein
MVISHISPITHAFTIMEERAVGRSDLPGRMPPLDLAAHWSESGVHLLATQKTEVITFAEVPVPEKEM